MRVPGWLLVALLVVGALPGRAQDDCPLCGHAAEYPDSPDGLFRRMRAACLENDAEKIGALMESKVDLHDPRAGLLVRLIFLCSEVGGIEVAGDRATLDLRVPGEKGKGPTRAERKNGRWVFTHVPFLDAVAGSADRSKIVDCKNNLKQLGLYISVYVSRYGSDVNYPEGGGIQRAITSLPDPARSVSRLPGEAGLFHCKCTGDRPEAAGLQQDIARHSSYAERREALSDRVRADAPVMWDKKAHSDGTRNVMRFDGSVFTVEREEFRRLLEQFGEALPEGFDSETGGGGSASSPPRSPAQILRTIVVTQSIWRQNDTDRNTISDYWTADVSGMYRVERLPNGSGIGIAALDVQVALADFRPVADGSACAGASIPGTTVTAGSMIALSKKKPLDGYWYAAIRLDPQGQPYATDPDGNGQAWTNTGGFAFCAFPVEYGKPHRPTYIVNEGGVIYEQDLGKGEPVEAWPGMNPTTSGWRVVQ